MGHGKNGVPFAKWGTEKNSRGENCEKCLGDSIFTGAFHVRTGAPQDKTASKKNTGRTGGGGEKTFFEGTGGKKKGKEIFVRC